VQQLFAVMASKLYIANTAEVPPSSFFIVILIRTASNTLHLYIEDDNVVGLLLDLCSQTFSELLRIKIRLKLKILILIGIVFKTYHNYLTIYKPKDPAKNTIIYI